MEVYARPGYYAVSHVLIGFFGAWVPLILWLGLFYQAGQYISGVRFFPVEWKIRRGNSAAHTGVKIIEILAGFIIGLVVRKNVERKN